MLLAIGNRHTRCLAVGTFAQQASVGHGARKSCGQRKIVERETPFFLLFYVDIGKTAVTFACLFEIVDGYSGFVIQIYLSDLGGKTVF